MTKTETTTAFAVYRNVPADAYGNPTYFTMVAGPYLTAAKARIALDRQRSADPAGTFFRYPVRFEKPTLSYVSGWQVDGPAF